MDSKYYIIYALRILQTYAICIDTDGVHYQDGKDVKTVKWEDIWKK